MRSFGNQSAGVDETEQIVDTIQSYREAMQLYLNLATNEHKELLDDLCGGIDKGLYEVYARMLNLNQICSDFL